MRPKRHSFYRSMPRVGTVAAYELHYIFLSVASHVIEHRMQDHDTGVEPLEELPTYASIVQRFGLYETDGKCNPQVRLVS
jgi:hypothetical protein